MNKMTVKVPASIANVGPGYDVFGIALSLYNCITVERSDSFSIAINGPKNDGSLPLTKENLVYQAIEAFYRHVDKPIPELKIDIECNIPLSSGLGSSSTAIAGAVAVVNKLEDDILSSDELVTLAWMIEGHPDNTTPALLGGFVISTITSNNDIAYKKISWPEEWKIMIAHPEYKLSTEKARAAIPKVVSLSDAISNISSASFLISAICTKDEETLKKSLDDKLHQPYRAKLVPGLTEIFHSLMDKDILGVALSGAGPSICVIAKNEIPLEVIDTIKNIWLNHGLESEFFFPEVENSGIQYICE